MVGINTMPRIEEVLPAQGSKAIANRELRARKVIRYLQVTEIAQMGMSLRRELRNWEKLVRSATEMGLPGIEIAALANKELNRSREIMLQLVGLPKRPGRIPEEQVKRIAEAIPEEITIEQPPQTSDNQSH